MRLKHVLLGAAVASTLVVGSISSASAQTAATTFDQEVEKVEDISDVIAGIVSAMTSVAILPMGIGASMKTFRHIVLNNV